MTANAQVESAIEAVHLGAFDYLQKPFEDLDQVIALVNRAAQRPGVAAPRRLRGQHRGGDGAAQGAARALADPPGRRQPKMSSERSMRAISPIA